MVRKSFSPSSSAIWREEEKAPASNAPSEVALRRTPEPWVATTWPLLSMSMTELALVSSTSLFRAVEMIASSRSEMMRLVSCSMYALPSVYAPNAGGTVREGDHQGEVTQWINADQAIFVFHEGTDDAAT